MEKFGDLIKRRREELGLSQEELAHLLGYKHKSSISKIEKGLVYVPFPKILAIVEALKLSPGDLTSVQIDVSEMLEEPLSRVVKDKVISSFHPIKVVTEKSVIDAIKEDLKHLNAAGRSEVQKRVHELTFVPEYKREE